MAESIVRLRVDSNEYENRISRARSGLLKLEDSLRKEGKTLAQVDSEQLKYIQSLGKMETVSNNARGQLKELTNAYTDLAVVYKNFSDEVKRSDAGKAWSASMDQLRVRIKGLQADLAGVNAAMGATTAKGFGASLAAGFGSAMSMFGPQMLAIAGVTAAIGGMKSVISDVINTNKQFEQSTANLAAVMGKTREQVSALTQQAKQLGATTQYTAMQITDLQTNLARLGFTQQEILNSTKAVQALATATGADLGEAANLAGAALRGFGMNAAEMERVASVLAVSTTKSALSFEKLATALPTVAPVAKQFGFTIEDTVTLLGKLADAGLDASTAGTATRKILLNLADSSGKLAQALGRPVSNIEELSEALVELTDKGIDLNKMLELTDVRSVTAFATFVDNARTLKDFKDSITDCSDALDAMVNEQLNTLQGSVTIMKSSWESLMLTFSNSNGIIKQTTDVLAGLLQTWANARNRLAGGDAAIASYEQGLTPEAKKSQETIYKAYKAGGTTDEQIQAKANEAVASLTKERDAARALYDELARINSLEDKSHDTELKRAWLDDVLKMFPQLPADKPGYIANDFLPKKIAEYNDKIVAQEYLAGMATQVVGTQQPKIGTTGTAEDNEKKLNELQKIQKEINDLSEEALTADEARREQIRERIAVLQQEEAEYKKILDYVKGINKESEPKTYDVTFAGPEESEFEKLQRSLAIQQADKIQAVDIASLTNLMQVAMQHGIDSLNLDFSAIYNRMLNGENIPDDVWTSLERTINEKLKELKLPQIELDITTGGVKQASADVSKLSTEWVQAAQAVGQFGSALQSVEDPTAKIAGIIAQAIASVAAGAGSAIAEAGTGSAGGPWGWIAFAISATATMVSTIAAIKSATSANYAQGGIVGGNSFSGDNMRGILPNGELIGLNSGETVLTAAQTGVLANAMKSNPMGNLNIEGILDGETIRLVLVNNALRRGGNRGEYAITKFG